MRFGEMALGEELVGRGVGAEVHVAAEEEGGGAVEGPLLEVLGPEGGEEDDGLAVNGVGEEAGHVEGGDDEGGERGIAQVGELGGERGVAACLCNQVRVIWSWK